MRKRSRRSSNGSSMPCLRSPIGLIGRAKDVDAKAAVYLCDRIFGRTTGAKVAPADDREAPYTDADFELDEQAREEDNDFRRLFQGSGATRGVSYNLNCDGLRRVR